MTESSIFKDMDILMKDRASLHSDYIPQSDFMEKIKFGLRGLTKPEDMLIQTKFFTIVTLEQILCSLLVNLIGTGDAEKTHKSIQIILYTTIQILQNDNKVLIANQNAKKKGSLDINEVMNQFMTQFFASIVEKSHSIDADLIKPFRKDIIELFNVDSFFQTKMINLKQW